MDREARRGAPLRNCCRPPRGRPPPPARPPRTLRQGPTATEQMNRPHRRHPHAQDRVRPRERLQLRRRSQVAHPRQQFREGGAARTGVTPGRMTPSVKAAPRPPPPCATGLRFRPPGSDAVTWIVAVPLTTAVSVTLSPATNAVAGWTVPCTISAQSSLGRPIGVGAEPCGTGCCRAAPLRG